MSQGPSGGSGSLTATRGIVEVEHRTASRAHLAEAEADVGRLRAGRSESIPGVERDPGVRRQGRSVTHLEEGVSEAVLPVVEEDDQGRSSGIGLPGGVEEEAPGAVADPGHRGNALGRRRIGAVVHREVVDHPQRAGRGGALCVQRAPARAEALGEEGPTVDVVVEGAVGEQVLGGGRESRQADQERASQRSERSWRGSFWAQGSLLRRAVDRSAQRWSFSLREGHARAGPRGARDAILDALRPAAAATWRRRPGLTAGPPLVSSARNLDRSGSVSNSRDAAHHQADRLRHRPAVAHGGRAGASVQRAGAGRRGAAAAADGEKILKLLARDGVLASHRGVKGGYSLSRPPEAISVAEVIGSPRGADRDDRVHRHVRRHLPAGGALRPAAANWQGSTAPAAGARRHHAARHGPAAARGAAVQLGRASRARRRPLRGRPARAPEPGRGLGAGPSGAPESTSEIEHEKRGPMQPPGQHHRAARAAQEYQAGFETDCRAGVFPPGLDEDSCALISAKKSEPEWLLEWRLKAFRHWLTMSEPTWANVTYGPIDYQTISYSGAQGKNGPRASTRWTPRSSPPTRSSASRSGSSEMLAGVAVDAVFDSVSVATTFKAKLGRGGNHLLLVLGGRARAPRAGREVPGHGGAPIPTTSSPRSNSAVFSDGSFVYVPKGVRCPMELSTYFRINAANTGQFERTLIVADEGAYVSYLEGCTAPMRDENQLHAAVVELVAHDRARSSTRPCRTGTPATRTARGASTTSSPSAASGRRGRQDLLDPGRDRLGHHLEVPELHPQGDNSVGEFYSVAVNKATSRPTPARR